MRSARPYDIQGTNSLQGEPLFDNDNNDIANGGVHGALLWLYGHDPFPETRSVETKICTYIYHAAEILEIADLREYTASVLKCIFQAALNGSFGDFFEILFSTLTTDPDAKRAVMGVVGEFCREHIAELQDHSDFRAYFEDYPELAMAILDFVAAVMKAKV